VVSDLDIWRAANLLIHRHKALKCAAVGLVQLKLRDVLDRVSPPPETPVDRRSARKASFCREHSRSSTSADER